MPKLTNDLLKDQNLINGSAAALTPKLKTEEFIKTHAYFSEKLTKENLDRKEREGIEKFIKIVTPRVNDLKMQNHSRALVSDFYKPKSSKIAEESIKKSVETSSEDPPGIF